MRGRASSVQEAICPKMCGMCRTSCPAESGSWSVSSPHAFPLDKREAAVRTAADVEQAGHVVVGMCGEQTALYGGVPFDSVCRGQFPQSRSCKAAVGSFLFSQERQQSYGCGFFFSFPYGGFFLFTPLPKNGARTIWDRRLSLFVYRAVKALSLRGSTADRLFLTAFFAVRFPRGRPYFHNGRFSGRAVRAFSAFPISARAARPAVQSKGLYVLRGWLWKRAT